MPMLADTVDTVVGVDTHRDTHEAEIAHPTGAPIATTSVSNSSSGYAELLAWIVDYAAGPRVVIVIEGTGSYGAGLARALAAADLTVLECEQPSRTARRGRGKSDAIDAHLAVLDALQLDAERLPTRRADGGREALRVLLNAREELTTTGTGQTNRLRALLLDGDDTDRAHARGKLTEHALNQLAQRQSPDEATRQQAVRQAEIRRLAIALRDGRRELAANRTQLEHIINDLTPGLTDQHGIGPISAAQIIVAFSHPGRCRDEAAFARLAGVSPLQASSGRTTRHRLNRSGDRALNQAIHTIAATRMRTCATTQAYVARRTAEGRTTSEIRRCLKRYIARQLHRTLTAVMTSPSPAAYTNANRAQKDPLPQAAT